MRTRVALLVYEEPDPRGPGVSYSAYHGAKEVLAGRDLPQLLEDIAEQMRLGIININEENRGT